MKKIFDSIKQIFVDNKEYFIKCTLMSIIAAFILGLAISFVVPASAAVDPTESDQTIIPSGVYTWIDRPNLFSESIDYGSNFIALPISTPSITAEGVTIGTWEGLNILINTAFTDSSYGTIQLSNGDDGLEIPIYADIPYLDFGIVYWDIAFLGTDGLIPKAYGQTFTVTQDTSVDSEIADWFFANTNGGGSVPDQYIISQGSYYLSTPTNLPFEINGDNEFFFQSGGSKFSSLRNDTIAIIYGNYVTQTPRRVYTFAGSDQGYTDFTLRSVTFLKDMVVNETTYNNFFASYKAVDESDEYQAGYEAGYNEGFSSGYDQGYQDGLNASAGSSDTFLGSIIEGVVDALDKLVIIGEFSVLDIIKTVIGGFVVVFLLKLIAGG